jgi:hypothetical protein
MYIPGPIVDTGLQAGYFNTAAFMTDTPVAEDRFATMPVLPAVPAYEPLNEEELHTLFEQAISDRLLAVNKQLSLKSGPLGHTQGLQLNTDPLSQLSQISHPSSMTDARTVTGPLQEHRKKLFLALLGNVWQRGLIFASLTLMLMLIGFDLMGLLVLHMR